MDNKKSFSLFQRCLSFVQNRPYLVLGMFFVLFGVSLWGLKFSKLELDIYDIYDRSFQSSVDLYDMKETYSDRSQMLVAFQFDAPPKAEELCSLNKWSKDLSRYNEIKTITSLWSIRAPKVEGSRLWYPRTLIDPCEMGPKEEFNLHDNFSKSFFRHLISKTGSKDLVFDVSFSGSDSSMSQVQYVIDETDKVLRSELPSVKVKYLGLSGSRYYFKKLMFKDSIYNLLVIVLIWILMRLIYGTWLSGFYLIITLITSNIVLYGVMGLTGISINILTNNLFLMTAVAGTADFIFVTQFQMKGNYQNSLVELIAPCFFTTLTTVVGFLSLNSSELSLIRQFGNGAALGAFCEWVMLFLFLPPLLKVLKKEKVWVNPEKALSSAWMSKIEKLSLPRSSFWVLGLLMVLSVPAFFYLNDQDSPVKNLPSNHVMRKGYEDFKKKFLWEGQVQLYFPEAPTEKEHKRIVSELSKSKLIYRIEDPEELASEWTKDLPPLKQDLIRRELSMTGLWDKYYSNGQLRIPLYLHQQDLHSLRELRDEVNKVCGDECRLAGQRVVYLEYGEKISKTMIESFAVSIILVIGILGWLLKKENKLQHLWPVTLSSLMGPLVTLSLISIFQVPVTLVTSIFLAVMVGLAGDNAIQYLMASGDLQTGIESRSKASMSVTLVMIIASSMFILQSLLPMKILGILFVFGFFINLVGDLWGLKGLLARKAD